MAKQRKVPTPAQIAAGIIRMHFYDAKMDSYLCDVEIDKCHPDPFYQRQHDQRHSQRLADEKGIAWPYPIMSYRDNTLHIVDGQHRVERDRKLGETEVTAVIKFDMRIKDEALLYTNLNYMKRPNSWNQFKSQLAAGSPKYIDMKKIADAYGLTLKCHYQDGDLRSVSTMIEAYECGLYEYWIKTMAYCFKDSDGRLQRRVSTGSIEFQRGLIDLMRRYTGEVITRQRVLNAIKQIGINLIMMSADEICSCSRTLRSHYMQAMEGMLDSRNLIPSPHRQAA